MFTPCRYYTTNQKKRLPAHLQSFHQTKDTGRLTCIFCFYILGLFIRLSQAKKAGNDYSP